ncbi:hypothetical protein [Bradyrhizobium sp. USDA 3650]
MLDMLMRNAHIQLQCAIIWRPIAAMAEDMTFGIASPVIGHAVHEQWFVPRAIKCLTCERAQDDKP